MLVPIKRRHRDHTGPEGALEDQRLTGVAQPGQPTGDRPRRDLDRGSTNGRRIDHGRTRDLQGQDRGWKAGERLSPGGAGADEQVAAGRDIVGDGGALAGRQAIGREVIDDQDVEGT